MQYVPIFQKTLFTLLFNREDHSIDYIWTCFFSSSRTWRCASWWWVEFALSVFLVFSRLSKICLQLGLDMIPKVKSTESVIPHWKWPKKVHHLGDSTGIKVLTENIMLLLLVLATPFGTTAHSLHSSSQLHTRCVKTRGN